MTPRSRGHVTAQTWSREPEIPQHSGTPRSSLPTRPSRAPPLLLRAAPPSSARRRGGAGRLPRQPRAPDAQQTSMQALRAKLALWNGSSQPTAPHRCLQVGIAMDFSRHSVPPSPPAARLPGRFPARPHTQHAKAPGGQHTYFLAARARAPAPPPPRAHPRRPFPTTQAARRKSTLRRATSRAGDARRRALLCVGAFLLLVPAGARPGNRDPWATVQRSSAAHSTMIVDDTNSSELLADGTFGRRPGYVRVDRSEDEGNVWLSARHDGYLMAFGLEHERRIFMAGDGDDIRGEDLLSRAEVADKTRSAKGFALRFHLHPAVQASLVQNGSSVLLRLPSGAGWRLIAEGGTVSLAESVYLGEIEEVRRSEQIVVSGALEAGVDAARVKWALKRVPKKS